MLRRAARESERFERDFAPQRLSADTVEIDVLPPGLFEALYDRYHVPTAGTVLREYAFANFHRDAPTKVDFHREGRAPLLFIGFGEDHLMPPKVLRHNEKRYDDSISITEYREFPGRPHFPAADGWEEVADYALTWAREHASLPAVSTT